jgi:hypothetical protein
VTNIGLCFGFGVGTGFGIGVNSELTPMPKPAFICGYALYSLFQDIIDKEILSSEVQTLVKGMVSRILYAFNLPVRHSV